MNTASAILLLEGVKYHVEISPQAKQTMEKKVTEFINQPVQRVFESREANASRDFVSGVSTVADKAIEIATKAGRSTVSSTDVEEAIRVSFCHVWPFCR